MRGTAITGAGRSRRRRRGCWRDWSWKETGARATRRGSCWSATGGWNGAAGTENDLRTRAGLTSVCRLWPETAARFVLNYEKAALVTRGDHRTDPRAEPTGPQPVVDLEPGGPGGLPATLPARLAEPVSQH